MKLIRPLVDESWEDTGFLSPISGSMALARALPSSTLKYFLGFWLRTDLQS